MPTFAHALRVLGYRTVLAGKMHFIGPDQLHGFEERVTSDVYPAGLDWVPDWTLASDQRLPWYHDMSSVRRAGPVRASLQLDYDEEVAFRARRAIVDSARAGARQPLLLVASFTHPHDPYEVPRRLWESYADVEIEPPAVPPLPLAEQDPHSRRLLAMFEHDRFPADADRTRAARRAYAAAISLVDEHVASLLATLEEVGMADDTMVVVCSDHGDMLGERGLWYKMSFFDGSARVPLVVHHPGRVGRRRVSQPVSLLDVGPTLVELGGGWPDGSPAAIDGRSLTGFLRGSGEQPPRPVLGEYLAEGVNESAGDGQRRRVQADSLPGRPRSAVRPGSRPARARQPRDVTRAAPRHSRDSARSPTSAGISWSSATACSPVSGADVSSCKHSRRAASHVGITSRRTTRRTGTSAPAATSGARSNRPGSRTRTPRERQLSMSPEHFSRYERYSGSRVS